MKSISFLFAICLLPIFIACAASAQSPAPASSPNQAAAQPATQQTLSKQVASDCYNRRRLAIRAVNLKYIALTQDASTLFTKENNLARAADANTWIKNLAWANDANLKGIAPDAKDRLGVLQAAYIKERVYAIITADDAGIGDVEAASKKAAAAGDQGGVVELAKQEDRIKQELRSIDAASVPAPVAQVPAVPAVPAAAPAAETAPASSLTAAAKIAADYNTAHFATVKLVNQKYIALALDAANLYSKEGNTAKSDEAKDWARRLEWTDDGNLLGISPDTKDRLGILQTTYLKERAFAVATVDKAYLDSIVATEALAEKSGDLEGAKALNQLIPAMRRGLAGLGAVAAQPAAAAQPGAPLTPGERVSADFSKARSDAVKTVNQKYAEQAQMAMDLLRGDGDSAKADAAKDWIRRLRWTDDAGNLQGLSPDAKDRLGALQAAYLKQRASALQAVDKAWLEKVKAAQAKSTPETDLKGAVALMQIMDVMNQELGLTAPPPVAAVDAPPTANSANPAPSPASQPVDSHPFGVEADKLAPAIPSPQ